MGTSSRSDGEGEAKADHDDEDRADGSREGDAEAEKVEYGFPGMGQVCCQEGLTVDSYSGQSGILIAVVKNIALLWQWDGRICDRLYKERHPENFFYPS